jgi:hypothetical protein
MTTPTQIKVEKADGIATITLNRPEKMNAYTGTMGAEIIAAMDDIDADDTVRAAAKKRSVRARTSRRRAGGRCFPAARRSRTFRTSACATGAAS